MDNACQTPMRDHVTEFWRILETEKVRVLIDMHQPDSFGGAGHWDSSSFSDDVAKALVADRKQNMPRGVNPYGPGTPRGSSDADTIYRKEDIARLNEIIENVKVYVLPPNSGFETTPEKAMGIYNNLVKALYRENVTPPSD